PAARCGQASTDPATTSPDSYAATTACTADLVRCYERDDRDPRRGHPASRAGRRPCDLIRRQPFRIASRPGPSPGPPRPRGRAARSKTASFAFDGFVEPLILRTYWSAAAWTSSSVAGGSKLWSVLMLRHMSHRLLCGQGRQPHPLVLRLCQSLQLAPQLLDLVAQLRRVLEAELLGGGEH